jgi:hypothetical protein
MLDNPQAIVAAFAEREIEISVQQFGPRLFRYSVNDGSLAMVGMYKTYARAVYMGAINWNKKAPAILYKMNLAHRERFFNLELANAGMERKA